MNKKRFKSVIDEDTMSIMPYLVSDKEEECFYNLQGCVDLLNELAEENEQLRKVCSELKKENQSLIENIFDIYEKVKWVSR